MKRPSMRALALATLLAAGVACGDSNGPVAGIIRINLTTPNAGADGAILFQVIGPAVPTQVSAGAGLRVFTNATLQAANKFVVTGTLTNGTILTLSVPDVNATHTPTVIQVAATSGFALRTSLTGYSLTATK